MGCLLLLVINFFFWCREKIISSFTVRTSSGCVCRTEITWLQACVMFLSVEAKRSTIKWDSFSVLWPEASAADDWHVWSTPRFQSRRSVEDVTAWWLTYAFLSSCFIFSRFFKGPLAIKIPFQKWSVFSLPKPLGDMLFGYSFLPLFFRCSFIRIWTYILLSCCTLSWLSVYVIFLHVVSK